MQTLLHVSVHPRVQSHAFSICAHVRDVVVHVRVRWIMETLKQTSVHPRLGSATLSQPAFPGESNPNFPQEKSPRNNTVNKTKQSKKEQQRKKTSELENCYQMNVKARKIYELIGAM